MQSQILQTKKHFYALDGLRGIAAICVVIFHFSEFIYSSNAQSVISHGYLAVDFFFCLSGFVVGYAYDDRMEKIGIKEFFLARLIRLHPLVVIGSVLGVLLFIFEPSKAIDAYSIGQLSLIFLCSALLIPFPVMDNRFNNNFGLNCPAWSLFWEYIANIAYALALKRISKRWLVVVVVVGAIGLLWTGHRAGSIVGGWSGGTFWDGFARIAFSFPMGLLLYRMQWKSSKQSSFLFLSIVLIAALCVPYVEKWNWLIECMIAIIVFPSLVVLGVNTIQNNITQKLCTFLGNISYPLYMTHYGLIWYFGYYHEKFKWSSTQSWVITAIGTLVVILLAYIVQTTLDTPIRRYLSNRRKRRFHVLQNRNN